MKISELKTGMILKHDDGTLSMVLRDTENGDIISGAHWFPINQYGVGIKVQHATHFNNVVEVWQPEANMDYLNGGISLNCSKKIWEAEPDIKKMTVEEISQALGYDIEVIKG